MSAAIKFTCPHCERICKVPAELGGKQGRCPGCRKGLEVPLETPAHLLSGRLDAAPEPKAEKATRADASNERPGGQRPSRQGLIARGASGRHKKRRSGRQKRRSELGVLAHDEFETGPILCKACNLNVPAGATHCPHCNYELRKIVRGGIHWTLPLSLVFAIPIPVIGILLARFALKKARERNSYENLAWFSLVVCGVNLTFGICYLIAGLMKG